MTDDLRFPGQPYDDSNVFAKIIRGEIPSFKLYEDEEILAILDAFPQSRGHSLIIPKKAKVRNLLEIDQETLNSVMTIAKKVAGALDKTLKPDGLTMVQFSGSAAGQTVFHYHLHVIPNYRGKQLAIHAGGAPTMGDKADLATLQEQLSKAIASS